MGKWPWRIWQKDARTKGEGVEGLGGEGGGGGSGCFS